MYNDRCVLTMIVCLFIMMETKKYSVFTFLVCCFASSSFCSVLLWLTKLAGIDKYLSYLSIYLFIKKAWF